MMLWRREWLRSRAMAAAIGELAFAEWAVLLHTRQYPLSISFEGVGRTAEH